MKCGVMSFGKHRGLPACDVPLDYLVWAMATMARPPACVIEELRRRASLHGTRDALEAQSVLNGFGNHSAKKGGHAAKKGRRVAAKRGRRPAARQAVVQHKNAAVAVGREFHAGREAWLAAGGDLSEPPF